MTDSEVQDQSGPSATPSRDAVRSEAKVHPRRIMGMKGTKVSKGTMPLWRKWLVTFWQRPDFGKPYRQEML